MTSGESSRRELLVRIIEPEPKKHDSFDLLKRAGEVIGIASLLGGFVISMGWSYAYEWFLAWKMPLHSLDIRFDDLFEYGRLAFWHSKWLLLIGATGLILIIWVIRELRLPIVSRPPILVGFVLLTTWLSLHYLGARAARSSFEVFLRNGFQGLPMAEITLKDGDTLPSFFSRDIAPGQVCYRMVFASKTAIWLARTRNGNADPVVAMLPIDSVALLRLYPAKTNCSRGKAR